MHKQLGEAMYLPTGLMIALNKEIAIVEQARDVVIK